jgi:preprotein translocase subunit SecB
MNEQPSIDLEPSGEDAGEQSEEARGGRASDAHTALSITRQYIKDLSFENPNAPGIYSSFGDESPELKVSVDIAASPLGGNAHEVVLGLSVTASYHETTAFIIELQYAAQAEFDTDVSGERAERVLMVEVPRYIFPFLRNIVANATREGGFPPLLLNPINFRKIHDGRRRTPAPDSPGGN